MSNEPKIVTTLRAILKAKNWSSMEASRQAGIPQSVIYRFQNGGGLNLESVEKLAKCLGLGLLVFSVPDGKKPTRGVKPEKPAPVVVKTGKTGRVTRASKMAKEQRAAAAKKASKKVTVIDTGKLRNSVPASKKGVKRVSS